MTLGVTIHETGTVNRDTSRLTVAWRSTFEQLIKIERDACGQGWTQYSDENVR